MSKELVTRHWEAAETEKRLKAQVDDDLPRLREGQAFEALGLEATREDKQPRGGFVAGTPPSFMRTVFDMEPGDARSVEGFGAVWIIRLESIDGADPEDPDTAALTEAIRQQARQGIAQDVFNAYGVAIQSDLGVDLNQTAINAVHANFQ